MSKKYEKKHYFCLLKKKFKKIFKKIFFGFYQLQQTPTWLVHKYSIYLLGFDMKNEIAASTNLIMQQQPPTMSYFCVYVSLILAYHGLDSIFMITLISSKNLGGCNNMRHTVFWLKSIYFTLDSLSKILLY